MRSNLDHELEVIHEDLIGMSTLLIETIDNTIKALVEQNTDLARGIVDGDEIFNQMQREIETKCIALIATQQPVASDLRRIFSVIKMVTDLERLADHCEDVSNITLKLANQEYVKPLIDLPKMASEVKEMVHMTIRAYIEQDVRGARDVLVRDDIVDRYFELIFDDIVALMETHCKDIKQCTSFLMIAKYFERMADHATNISEWTIYGIEGITKDEVYG